MKTTYKTKSCTKTTISTVDKVTDIVTDGSIVVLALAGTGIAAPAIGVWSGILAGTSGIVVASIFGLKTVKKTIELLDSKE